MRTSRADLTSSSSSPGPSQAGFSSRSRLRKLEASSFVSVSLLCSLGPSKSPKVPLRETPRRTLSSSPLPSFTSLAPACHGPVPAQTPSQALPQLSQPPRQPSPRPTAMEALTKGAPPVPVPTLASRLSSTLLTRSRRSSRSCGCHDPRRRAARPDAQAGLRNVS